MIRIGTLVNGKATSADYIKQILPHGFESFSITFWQQIPADVNVEKLGNEVKEVIGDKAVISSLGVFGNPLVDDVTAKSWMQAIDACKFFGCDIVGGFAGRIIDKPIDESMPRFKEVFTPIVKYAADKGVKIAFENCDMGGTWERGDFNIAQNETAWDMMFNEIPDDNMGLEWEPCHQMVSLIDPMPGLRKYVEKIFHVHGKDATVLWDVVKTKGVHGPDTFAYHRTPGFGDSNWTEIISVLRQGGFDGSIDIEGWHDPVYRGELEMTGQVYGLNYLKNCRGGDFVANPTE